MQHSNRMTSPRTPPTTASSQKLLFTGNQLQGGLSALSSSISLAGIAGNVGTSSTTTSNPLSLLSFLDASSVTMPSGLDSQSSFQIPSAKPATSKSTLEEDELVRRIHQKVGGPTKLSTYEDPASVRRVVIEALAREQGSPVDMQRIQRGQLSVSERRVVRTVTNRGAAVRSRMRQRREMAALRSEVRERDGRVRQLEAVVKALCSTYAVPLPSTVVSNEIDPNELQKLQHMAGQNNKDFNISHTLDLTSKHSEHKQSYNADIFGSHGQRVARGDSDNTMNSSNIGRCNTECNAPMLPDCSPQFDTAIGTIGPSCGNRESQEDQMTMDLSNGSSSAQNTFNGFSGENTSMSQLKWT